MAENDQFITEMLRGIESSISDLRGEVTGIRQDIVDVERRLTASNHFEQAVLSHLTSIHEGVDNLKAGFLGLDRRMKVLEGR